MKTYVCLATALALMLGACNYPAGGDGGDAPPQAWIDRPLEGSRFLLGDNIPIQWHASGDHGLRRVEVHANGEVLDVADALEGDLDPDLILVDGEFEWSPAEAGEYLVQVFPTGPDDAEGAAAENRVQVFAEGGTVAGMVAKDLNLDGDSDDDGEGPLEGATIVVVYCGDKRALVTDASGHFEITDLPLGSCVLDAYKDGWFFASTFPAGLDFPIHFSPDPEAPISFTVYLSQAATPTPEPTATRAPRPFIPTVPPVIASPEIPTKPAPDTQRPPMPTIISPNGVMLACLDDVILRWNPVDDASGIDVYQVELYVSHNNGGSWQGAGSWSLDQFTNLGVRDQTDCGLMYMWKVRARDNAGNTGGWRIATFGIGID
jgi:hypothetical protein